MTHIQSIRFKKQYYTVAQAIEWLKVHNKKYTDVDSTTYSKYHAFRQIEPDHERFHYRTVPLTKTIIAINGFTNK